MTREEWLTKLSRSFNPWFTQSTKGMGVPDNLKVSCGWPSRGATSESNRSLGQCWSDEASTTRTHEIFISPWLDKANEVGATLAHEIIHAIVGHEEKHGGQFKVVAKQIGLVGKMTHTETGPALQAEIERLVANLGPYPHGQINTMVTTTKKQSTRMVKCTCKECGYTIRVAKSWIVKGVPLCQCQINKFEPQVRQFIYAKDLPGLIPTEPITDNDDQEDSN